METVNGELETRYQKIATEYSKIRAQAKILKSAVIEEQSRNADIREQLKGKEVQLRQAEQELDSLSFRNQQLEKRITFLQEELDKTRNKPKKYRNKSSESKTQPLHSSNHILDEEFQKKIIENAQLLSQMGDKDSEIEAMREEIKLLENKLNLCEKSKSELEIHYHDVIERLDREKDDLQRKLSEKDKQEDRSDSASRTGINNVRKNDLSASSSPVSQRSSKSILETDSRKPWITLQEENGIGYDSTKPCELEKELNHWKAQYNILKIKYDEITSKHGSETPAEDNSIMEPIEISNMIGKLTAPFSLSTEIEARELKYRDYFLAEIDKLISDKHLVHVKNLAIAADNEAMSVHLEMSEAQKEKYEAELKESLLTLQRLQEDKEIQEGNYNAQLSTMSEHLANMNEKLIRQTEEIQQLKFELANKNSKRGK